MTPGLVSGPEFGGHEDIAAVQAEFGRSTRNPLADAGFVVVGFGSVDVAVSDLDGLVDGAGCVFVLDQVRAESYER